ncbi:DUF3800 domain-containing protein [Rhizobium phaseoli]|uniref:DUF3800 domain-containing protein n=1 Tax=Rhizobium phaseoli TaxID=396 RepID=UPI000BE8DB72|nr:DUF3800 domain-containing protein [Rhizobium phaseoli]PDS68911.1 hypothetical protein CO651_26360 [Rhizobium phaseoli]
MKIFCDESGGFDGDKHSLLVAAVRVTEHDAARIMKQFRKAIGATNEVKGGLLTDGDRAKFFDMLAASEHLGVVVTCGKTSSLGSIVARSHSEHHVLEEMITEACSPLIDASGSSHVISDGGRYSRQIYDQISENLGHRLSRSGVPVRVDFVRSDVTPGVQIADIVANTLYKATRTESDLSEHPACGFLIKDERIVVSSATLQMLRPDWLAAE